LYNIGLNMPLPPEQVKFQEAIQQSTRVDVERFHEDAGLLTQLPVLVMTVKTWDNTGLRASRAQAGKSGVNYGMDKRKDLEGERGGLVVLDPANREFRRLGNKDIYGPRGIEVHGEHIFVGTSKGVEVFDKTMQRQGTILDDFGYCIHAVRAVEIDGSQKLIMGSSRLGTMMEYDFATGQVERRWVGWENGFPQSHAGVLVTASEEEYEIRIEAGGEAVLFDKSDPKANLEKLTTSRQASRINGIFITPDKMILATLFSGQLIELKEVSERSRPRVIAAGLFNPHSPQLIEDNYWAANTHRGEVVRFGLDGELICSYAFSNSLVSEGKIPVWLQSIVNIDGLMVAVDSTRQELVVLDIENQQRTNVSFPDGRWAVQEVTSFES